MSIAIARHATAIIRRKLSKPMMSLIADSLIDLEWEVFDYGCGRGEDISILKKQGFSIEGYDPYYKPHTAKKNANIINLGYVLNVIEDVGERNQTLLDAFHLAKDLLVVSVMIRENVPMRELEQAYGDGILTSWNTFQKYYDQSEFRGYLVGVLNLPPESIVLSGQGVAYIFKNDEIRQKYLQNRFRFSKYAMNAEFREAETRRIISEWLSLFHELGRPPAKNEFKDLSVILRYFGSIEKACEAVRAEIHTETLAENAEMRKKALAVSIARNLIGGQGKAKLADLEPRLHNDVRLFFGNYIAAESYAKDQMKSLADLRIISKFINESKVGKVLPDDIYIHIDALSYAPDMLQILVELAKMILPKDVPFNMVKIARNNFHISFLHYPQFYDEPHPTLASSMKVLYHKNKLKFIDYRKSENQPILHRKETFLNPEHEKYEEYSQLTLAEEKAGLLNLKTIGYRRQWEAFLTQKNLTIINHRLLQAS